MRIGTCEIFEAVYFNCSECDETWHEDAPFSDCDHVMEQEKLEGYWYWCCFMGCMPEGDAIGPFKTEDEAIQDATDNDYIEEDEPDSENDAFITPCGSLGSKTGLSIEGKFIGEYDSDEEAIKAFKEICIADKYWCTLWHVSDHGNHTLVNLD